MQRKYERDREREYELEIDGAALAAAPELDLNDGDLEDTQASRLPALEHVIH